MYEKRFECDRFDQWLLDDGTKLERPVWREHLAGCSECREQWHAHQMLAATFATEEVPELSPDFDAALDRRLAAAVEIKPLRGWRLAAMLAYAGIALALLAWAMKSVPLPTIDLSAPWVPVAVLLAVPLTFILAIGAARLIPMRRIPPGLRSFAL